MSYTYEASVVPIILLCLVMSVVEQGVIYVLPNNSSWEVCPVEQCFTLKKVVENKIFVSNTKIVLFPALHVLSDDFDISFISNISNISFTCESTGGKASCHIQCTGSAGFFFHNVINVSISDIFFGNCGASVSRYFEPMDQLYGASVVLLFRYSTNITFARVTVVGRMDYGIAMVGPQENVALINTTLKVPSQGVCFYAAMDNRLSLRPLIANLVMNNVSFIDETYNNNNGATCLAVLMQTEYQVKICMTDIYILRDAK